MQEPFDRKFLGGATEHYAPVHLDIISESLHGGLRTRSYSIARLQQHHRIGCVYPRCVIK
jgi:hypothetical protein